MTAAYFSTEYKDVVSFGLLVVILLFRPTGLLGKPEVEKYELTTQTSPLYNAILAAVITFILSFPF